MASKWKNRAIDLIIGLAFTNKKNPAPIPYAPAKTEVSAPERKYFHRTYPERAGVSSKTVYDMLVALEGHKMANVHNIMVLRGKEVICECSAPGYDVNVRHLSHSMSKSLTGMAIGMLIDDGLLSLDTKIKDIFPEYRYTDRRFGDITIHHLLSMSTGVPFSEAGSVTETEWTKAFFEPRLAFAPGTNFAYNSMNSYILARVVVKLAKKSLTEFLRERLFSPLGITNVFWEKSPEGIDKGGWGVYLSVESWAKIGVMILSGGVFDGHRILSEDWIKKSTSTQMRSPDATGGFNYGYQIWVNKKNDELLFNGMLGQNVWICPRNNIVAVVNCENNELFQKSPVIDIIQKYLGGDLSDDEHDIEALIDLRKKEKHFFDSRRFAHPKEIKRGIFYRIGLRRRQTLDDAWNEILGTYTFADNNHGILPLFIRAMQNNYTGGIESVSFERDGEHLFFTSREGGVDYRLEVGTYDFKTTVLDVNGEKYMTCLLGEPTTDGSLPGYRLHFVFPEMPNSRKISFSFGADGRLIMKLTESPNEKIAEPLVEAIYTTNPTLAFAVKILEKRLGDKLLNRKLQSLFAPTLVGANTNARGYLDILDSENQKARKEGHTSNAIGNAIIKVAEKNGKQ